MAELTVGTWNTLNAFGDERAEEAIEIVKGMDADVLFLGETTLREEEHGGNSAYNDYAQQAFQDMVGLGYREHLIGTYAAYPGVRDMHTMTMWSRLGTTRPGDIRQQPFGERNAMILEIPELALAVYGVHLSDQGKKQRQESASALAENWKARQNRGEISGAIKMGDFNNTHGHGLRNVAARAAGNTFERFVTVEDFYNHAAKFKRLAGKVIRAGEMADGTVLDTFMQAGFVDADPQGRPTRTGFQLDHILGVEVDLVDFTHHPRSTARHPKPLSDHTPITATVRR